MGDAFYHVYVRGNNKQRIFLDDQDHGYLLKLFKRYLSLNPELDKHGIVYPHYKGSIQLLAFCTMGNHFHLLLWQEETNDISRFMQSVMTSYCRYFNLKYKRTGSIFESRYKASLISDNGYLQHISRYIHLNPRYWQRYPHSSLRYYYSYNPEWLTPQAITELFEGKEDYFNFLKDYEGHKAMLDEIKHQLADG